MNYPNGERFEVSYNYGAEEYGPGCIIEPSYLCTIRDRALSLCDAPGEGCNHCDSNYDCSACDPDYAEVDLAQIERVLIALASLHSNTPAYIKNGELVTARKCSRCGAMPDVSCDNMDMHYLIHNCPESSFRLKLSHRNKPKLIKQWNALIAEA